MRSDTFASSVRLCLTYKYEGGLKLFDSPRRLVLSVTTIVAAIEPGRPRTLGVMRSRVALQTFLYSLAYAVGNRGRSAKFLTKRWQLGEIIPDFFGVLARN